MNVVDRIELLLRERGVPPRKVKRKVSEVCGVTYEAVRQWFAGTTEHIDIRYLELIAEHFRANLHWIRTGEGPRDSEMLSESVIQRANMRTTDDEKFERQQATYEMALRNWEKYGLDETAKPVKPSQQKNTAIYLNSPMNQAPINPVSTWDSDTPLDDDETEIRFLKSVEGSAGTGSQVAEVDYGYKLRFSKRTLSRLNIVPDNAVCIMVSGNSMEPQLPDGSTVGVDTGDKNIKDGKIYAINHGNMIRIKVLYKLPSGIRIRSYNQEEHPDETYTHQEMEEQNIFVIGRVFWSSVLY